MLLIEINSSAGATLQGLPEIRLRRIAMKRSTQSIGAAQLFALAAGAASS
jgi:hypothetical protein